ncbi:MAG: MarR family transcriptional regulator, partial [Bacteroidota bacterium]
VLFMLWVEDGRNQAELAEWSFKDKTTITRGLQSLEKLNLVVRITDEKDKRNKLIFLTHKGRELKNKVMPLAAATMEDAIQDISKEELNICRKVLGKIYNNLNTK